MTEDVWYNVRVVADGDNVKVWIAEDGEMPTLVFDGTVQAANESSSKVGFQYKWLLSIFIPVILLLLLVRQSNDDGLQRMFRYIRRAHIPNVIAKVIALTCIALACTPCFSQAAGPEAVSSIINAIRDSQLPSSPIYVEWRKFGDNAIRAVREGVPPPDYRWTEVNSTLWIDGLRSRIESEEAVYADSDKTNLQSTRNTIAVYDGEFSRSLIERSSKPQPTGRIAPKDLNRNTLENELFQNPVNFQRPETEETQAFQILSDDGTHIVLQYTEAHGNRKEIIVDRSRGYCVEEVKAIRAIDDTVDYEVKYTYKEYPNGRWFLETAEKIRYDRESGEPQTESMVEVNKVEFDVSVDETLFQISYPTDAMIWDDVVGDWTNQSDLIKSEELPSELVLQANIESARSATDSDETQSLEDSSAAQTEASGAQAFANPTSIALICGVLGLLIVSLIYFSKSKRRAP